MMSQDENGPSEDRVFATLRVYRDDLDPDIVSDLLGKPPDRVQRKDRPYLPGGTHVAPTGAWFFSSKALESKDLEDHVNWILDQFEPKHDAIHQLQVEGYEVEVSCYWLSVEGRVLLLSPAIMRRLSELELPLWVDIY
jgi:hypothetical protein